MKNRTYLCIDLKSFYASVECRERGLDAMTTNLVVADSGRTEKTICLAVSPSLKSFGIPGRPRLFEVVTKINAVNNERKQKSGGKSEGKSWDYLELQKNPLLQVDYIIAPPRMALYMEYSTKIFEIYLKYVAPEDIHIYSIDEVFMDITGYMREYNNNPEEFARTIIKDVLKNTGITATAGIGTNMYLAKVAMDIVAKHTEADEYGVRIARLDEKSYRETLWNHTPLTDFWRVGKAYARKLQELGINTMGDVALKSVSPGGEDLLYKIFGVGAEFLIDHAWGWEPCKIEDIRAYTPKSKSIGSGQVLHTPYTFDRAKLVTREMTELLVLDLVEKNLVTRQAVLTVGYDIENLNTPGFYKGEVTTDAYGRKIPKHAHGTVNLEKETSSSELIVTAVMELYDKIVNPKLLIRRINITVNDVKNESEIKEVFVQTDLFTDSEKQLEKEKMEKLRQGKEKNLQKAIITLKKKYGKNAIIKGMNLEEGATAMDRNNQIGGHKA